LKELFSSSAGKSALGPVLENDPLSVAIFLVNFFFDGLLGLDGQLDVLLGLEAGSSTVFGLGVGHQIFDDVHPLDFVSLGVSADVPDCVGLRVQSEAEAFFEVPDVFHSSLDSQRVLRVVGYFFQPVNLQALERLGN